MIATLPVATAVDPRTTPTLIPLERQFYLMLKIVLERVYRDGIDRFLDVQTESDRVTGQFQDGLRRFQFELSRKGLTYSPVKSQRGRQDGYLGSFRESLGSVQRFDDAAYLVLPPRYSGAFRVDARTRSRVGGVKPRNCRGSSTYPCGGACIEDWKECHVGGSGVATSQEMDAILRVGKTVSPKSKTSSATSQSATAQPTPPSSQTVDPYEDLKIRDLQKIASEKGVYRSHHMNKEELKAAIRLTDTDPKQQERVRKTLERKEQQRQNDPFKEFRRITGLNKLWRSKGSLEASLVAATMVTGLSMKAYEQVRQRYRGGFAESANTAQSRAAGIEVPTVPRNQKHVTFTVDGFAAPDVESRDRRVENALRKADPQGFGKSHHFVSIPGQEYTHLSGAGANLPGPLRGAVEAFEGSAKSLHTTLVRGRNPQAVELAAQMHAYDQKYNYYQDGTRKGQRKPAAEQKILGIVAEQQGGSIGQEALEIFKMIDPIAAGGVRAVYLGTPHFGLTEQVAKTGKTGDGKKIDGRTLTLISQPDAGNFLPRMNGKQMNTVKGSKVEDYVSDPRTLEVIKGTIQHNLRKRGGSTPKKKPDVPNNVKQYVQEQVQQELQKKRASESSSGVGQNPVAPDAEQLELPFTEKSRQPKRSSRSKPRKKRGDGLQDAYLEAFQRSLQRRDQDVAQPENPDLSMAVRSLLKRAISPINPSIAAVLSFKLSDGVLAGRFVDHKRRLFEYEIANDKLNFQEIVRQDADDDECIKGADCGKGCVKRGNRCQQALGAASRALVKVATKAIETEQIPSHQEVAKLLTTLAGQAVRNPVKAIQEGNRREQAMREALEAKTGVKAPSRAKAAIAAARQGVKAMKSYLKNNPEIAKEAGVVTAGLVGNTIGGAVAGPVGGIAGEIASTAVTRKGMRDYEALQKARAKLKHDEAFQAAGRLKKARMLQQASISELKEMRKKTAEEAIGDVTGATVGGAAGTIAGNLAGSALGPVGGLVGGVVAGVTSGMTSAQTAQGTYRKVQEGKKLSTAAQEAVQETTLASTAKAAQQGEQREAELRKRASEQIREVKRRAGGGS